jgi:4-hydroxybenzoate polyprenyltransferase
MLFSIIASSVYVLNDLMDIEEDRQHPEKCMRPLASGLISSKQAKILIVFLVSLGLFSAFTYEIDLFFVLLVYFLLNVAYSLKLKHVSIIDVFIISIGFILRLFAGSTVTNIRLSMWIIIMTFLLALFLAVAKRRDDVKLAIDGKSTRKNIDGYNLELVNALLVFLCGVIVVAYIQYTISAEVVTKFNSEYLYLTTIFVVLGLMRYLQLTFVKEYSGNPTKIVLKDRFLQLTIIFWFSLFALLTML